MSVQLEEPISKFNTVNWKDPNLEDWIENVKIRQQSHYSNNNKTGCFQYADTELDAIQLRVCQTLFGLRLSNTDHDGKGLPKGTPASMLKMYPHKERREARKLQVKIVKFGRASDGTIKMNVVFVSVAFLNNNNGYNSAEIRVFILGDGDNKGYLDASGRFYRSWEEYLTENELPKGLMIYPKDGHYCLENSDTVVLNARETPSCSLTARTKDYLDKAATIGGVLLIGTTVVAPMAAFSAATMASIANGSFYLGSAISTYSAITGTYEMYDKIKHDENAISEMIMLGTTAFTTFSQWYVKKWAEKFAASVANKELWSNVSQGITKTQKIIFATQNLIRIGLSASSVLGAMWNLWNKKERSWSDWKNFIIACYFFANAIVKPITLQGLFESEQGKYMQQHFASKITTEEAKAEYEKTVKNARTTEQKTYLTRNLEMIDDLDEHFYQVHETGTIVEYTENGMIINNAVTISPEAYNQIGKNYYQNRLNEVKLLPKEQRNAVLKELTKDFEPETRNLTEKFVNGDLTENEQKKLEQDLAEISNERKAKLFGHYEEKNNLIHRCNNFMENKQEILQNFEKILTNPNKILENPIEIWNFCKFIYENPKLILENPEFFYNLAKEVFKNCKVLAEMFCTVFKSVAPEKTSEIVEEIVENFSAILDFLEELMKNGMVLLNLFKTKLTSEIILMSIGMIVKYRKTISKIFSNVKNNPKLIFRIVEILKSVPSSKNIDEFWITVKMAMEEIKSFSNEITKDVPNDDEYFEKPAEQTSFEEEIVQQEPEQVVEETVYEDQEHSSVPQTRFLIKNISFEMVKTELEQAFDVTDYREARVNGRLIFKLMKTGDVNRLHQIIENLPADPISKKQYFGLACKFSIDAECRLKAESSRQFADILEIVRIIVEQRQAIPNLPKNQIEDEDLFLDVVLNNGPGYTAIKDDINTLYGTIVSTNSIERQLGIFTVEAKVGQALNHRITGVEDSRYLATRANEVFQESIIINIEEPANDQQLAPIYGAHLSRRQTFGTTVTTSHSTDPSVAYSREETPIVRASVQEPQEMFEKTAGRIGWIEKFGMKK
uniref:DUF4781 domain-containing protein n=1 Tax=Panagrolaimus sp. JU765 TaxID=591449 RepID=A0AC34PZL6_9BILA